MNVDSLNSIANSIPKTILMSCHVPYSSLVMHDYDYTFEILCDYDYDYPKTCNQLQLFTIN